MKLNTTTEITNPQGVVRNITTYYDEPNTPPELVGARISVEQDTTYTFTTADISNFFTDIESSNPLSIKIESTPIKGRLRLNGDDLQIGAIVLIADIGNISYEPPTGAFGIYYSSFKIRVNDDGIAPNPFSEVSRIIIDIAAIQPPSVLDNCITVIEGQDYQFQLVDFSVGYQDDNTVEPEFISFIELPINGQIVSTPSTIFTDPITIPKATLPVIQYRPPSGIYSDSFKFQVGDDQTLFSSVANMLVKILSKPTLDLIHILKFCFGDSRSVKQDIDDAYSNNDQSGIKSIEITFIHAGYSLLLSGVQVSVGQIIHYSNLEGLVLEVTDTNAANMTIQFTYKVTSINDIESDPQNYLATIGEVADFDCQDFDEDDFFTFNQ